MRFFLVFFFSFLLQSSFAQDKDRSFDLYQELIRGIDCTCNKVHIQDRKNLTAIPPAISREDSVIFKDGTNEGDDIFVKLKNSKPLTVNGDVYATEFIVIRNGTTIAFPEIKELKNIDPNSSEAYLSKRFLYVYLRSIANGYSVKLIFDRKKFVTKFFTKNDTVNQFDFLDGTAK